MLDEIDEDRIGSPVHSPRVTLTAPHTTAGLLAAGVRARCSRSVFALGVYFGVGVCLGLRLVFGVWGVRYRSGSLAVGRSVALERSGCRVCRGLY